LRAKLLLLALTAILVVGGTMGCSLVWVVDRGIGEETNPYSGDATNSPRYRIKSGGTKFDVDNVTLDFYYGGSGVDGSYNPFFSTDSSSYFVCFALYFLDGQRCLEIDWFGTIEAILDSNIAYYDIDGHHLIKTLTRDEFNSEEYYVLTRNRGNHTFNHQETMTVPREVFERESGSFVFQVAEVWFLPSTDCYGIAVRNFIHVNYDYIDEQTVRLSKPVNSTPR